MSHDSIDVMSFFEFVQVLRLPEDLAERTFQTASSNFAVFQLDVAIVNVGCYILSCLSGLHLELGNASSQEKDVDLSVKAHPQSHVKDDVDTKAVQLMNSKNRSQLHNMLIRITYHVGRITYHVTQHKMEATRCHFNACGIAMGLNLNFC